MMDKMQVLNVILDRLECVYQNAHDSAQRAYDTATDEENEAENKYDTLGLEASYLAFGQSKRVLECEADLITFKKLNRLTLSQDEAIVVGALILIEDEQGIAQRIFLSPVAGGLKVTCDQHEIMLITPSAPMGQALIGGFVGDEVDVKIANQSKSYRIVSVC